MSFAICSKCWGCFNFPKCYDSDSFVYCVYSTVDSCVNPDPNNCDLDCNSYVPVGSVPIHDSDSEIPF